MGKENLLTRRANEKKDKSAPVEKRATISSFPSSFLSLAARNKNVLYEKDTPNWSSMVDRKKKLQKKKMK